MSQHKAPDTPDEPTGPTVAEIAISVFDAALDAARSIEDDAFPEWRVRSLRDAREFFAASVDDPAVVRPLGSPHVETVIDCCQQYAPTPHGRIAYEAEHGIQHPRHGLADSVVALRPFLGDELPEVPTDADV